MVFICKVQSMHISTTIANQELWLLPEKAVYWPAQKALLLADAHLGKGGHFRKHGLPIPLASMQHDLARLGKLVTHYRPEIIYYLGDLFHSDPNPEWDLFSDWMKQWESVNHVLIRGNHDRALVAHPLHEKLQIEDTFQAGPFMLTHVPQEEPGDESYNLCGHIHPGVRLRGKGRQHAKLPCFWFGEKQGILPAFGNLTGAVALKGKAKVFAVAQDQLFAL
jgi:DNA ligase-associated metallophosphoesterase